jgi:hypothetical protein
MADLTVLLGVLFIAGSLGCEGPKPDPPLDNATINAGLDPRSPRIFALVAPRRTRCRTRSCRSTWRMC